MNSRIFSNKQANIFPSIIIVLITISIWLFKIDRMSLWPDEIFTAYFAHPDNSLSQVIKGAFSTPIPAPPFIFVISHLWMKLFGFSDGIIRIPFVIGGALGIPAIYLVGKELFNKRVGFISGFLLFFSSFQVFHSREARYYPFLLLFSLLTIYYFHKGIKTNNRKWWLGYILFTSLNLYTFFTSLFVLAAQGIYIGALFIIDLAKKKYRDFNSLKSSYFSSYLLSLGTIFLLFTPLIPPLMRGLNSPRGIGTRKEPFPFTSEFLIDGMLAKFGAGKGFPQTIMLTLAVLGLLMSLRKYYQPISLFIIISVLPFMTLPIFSIKHWVEYKYFIFILPLYLIIVALGIDALSKILQKYIVDDTSQTSQGEYFLLILILGIIYNLNYSYYRRGFAKEISYWREQGDFVNQTMEPDDVFVTYKISSNQTLHTRKMFSLYFDPIHSNQENINLVANVEDLIGLSDRYNHVFFQYGPVGGTNLEAINMWLNNIPNVKLKFNNFTIIYISNKSSEEIMLANINEDFTFFIGNKSNPDKEIQDE